jgi:PBP1b-binding outer membrane lipoprotein LpoB
MKLREALTIAALLLAGCAATPPSPAPEADAEARLFKPVADKAVIYILRDRGDFFTGPVRLTVDGKDVGETVPNTYLRVETEPGTKVIVSRTDPPATLELKTLSGGLYYVWQDVTAERLREYSALRVVDRNTARQVLTTSTIVITK